MPSGSNLTFVLCVSIFHSFLKHNIQHEMTKNISIYSKDIKSKLTEHQSIFITFFFFI